MSSHHVVRENQEPALIIDALEGIQEELLGQLLEWSPTVITSAANIQQLDHEGYKVDVVFAQQDMPSLQEHLKFVPLKNDFLLQAIQYLIDHDYKAAHILTNHHPDTAVQQLIPQIDLVFINGKQKHYFVKSGFNKWIPKGRKIQLYAEEKDLEVVGLRKLEKNEYISVEDGFFSLCFLHQPYLLISEEL